MLCTVQTVALASPIHMDSLPSKKVSCFAQRTCIAVWQFLLAGCNANQCDKPSSPEYVLGLGFNDESHDSSAESVPALPFVFVLFAFPFVTRIQGR